MTDFNYKALELLKDTAVLAQQKELDELILIASAEDDTIAQVMTGSAGASLVKLLMVVVGSTEQLGALLLKDPENLVLLKKESNKLQQLLAKIGVS
ncbi:MAG: hypothetical protein E7156_00295 [Streptococcus gallolyticus]|uniref:Uncharacterized protein n=1 Tax=Streptococcus gallolyticus TaxID=315405 RepID=A0A928A9N9_9STRE|nr:hypothetical protein [Streptococcus gallolyticus]MBE6163759.1 hypothetical protein [Streptococcus gallolyticus]